MTNGLIVLRSMTNGLIALRSMTNGLIALRSMTNGLIALRSMTNGLIALRSIAPLQEHAREANSSKNEEANCRGAMERSAISPRVHVHPGIKPIRL